MTTNSKLLVFDSHPVQYRVPIWQTMEQADPGSVHVVYASDCSVRGYADKEFGHTIAWDDPLLTGYTHTILNNEKGVPLSNWGSLTGRGVGQVIRRVKPDAVLLTGMNYQYDLVAYWQARRQGIPVWLRCETQDQAIVRSAWKAQVRSVIYRMAYRYLDRIFFIGQLNKTHYLKHGLVIDKLKPALYGTVDRFSGMSYQQKQQLRFDSRAHAGIDNHALVIGFSGKFIPKKNPDMLFELLQYLPEPLLEIVHLYFIGSGPMEAELKATAAQVEQRFGVKTTFAGFINQSQLVPHYLMMDIMILPSRRMGETWGLVTNEAMQAGCGVVVSEAVGCSEDFKNWERFRVFREKDAEHLANCVAELSVMPRSFQWASSALLPYSIKSTADSILTELKKLSNE